LAVKRVYWDSCAWIGLIRGEADKVIACQYVLDEAKAGRIQIWTSALTIAEVYKVKCGGAQTALPADKEQAFLDLLSQDFVVRVAVTVEIATFARALLRQYLNKPNDAIHLATAALNNLDEFHTYDKNDILPLDGKIKRVDGELLKVKRPPEPPPGTALPMFDDKKKASDAAT